MQVLGTDPMVSDKSLCPAWGPGQGTDMASNLAWVDLGESLENSYGRQAGGAELRYLRP